MPMPTIIPTAYSARYTVAAKEESSPLPYTGTVELARSADSLTPKPKTYTQPRRTPVQPGNTPESGADGRQANEDVTSSVMKGEAANGLLELIRAAAET